MNAPVSEHTIQRYQRIFEESDIFSDKRIGLDCEHGEYIWDVLLDDDHSDNQFVAVNLYLFLFSL